MQVKLLIAVAVLIGSSPVFAQDFAPAPNAAIVRAVSYNPTVSNAPMPAAPVPALHLDTKHSAPVVTRDLFSPIARANESRASAIDSMYDYYETPFVSNLYVTVASIAGGRLQLAGYHSYASSENFQMGLPGGGTLPAWGVTLQSHPAVTVPLTNESGGFNVTFYFRGNEPGALHLRPVQAINHAVMFIRGI